MQASGARLLPKKGDLRDLRNWRPVSLLSTDYKIVAKAISLRLGSVMADVVHPDQTYTVPGRSIFDNLFLVRDLLELGRRDGLSFARLSLDQEKAFDRVDHGYLLSTLQAFGFGPQFVSFLRVLYASAECLVRLNWTLTEPVSFGRGVRQGCPLSGQLYALAIEPFLCLLRRRMTGLVLREPELRLVLSAYADDVLLVVQDPGDLARVEACQAIYSAASSARVNWVKSSGLAVGDWRQETHTDPTAEDSWHLEWGDRVYFSHFTIRQAGVATLFSPDLRPEVVGVAEAVPARLLHLQVCIEGLVVNLVNVYAPTSGLEWLQFSQQASAFLGTLDSHECLVLGGDFNTTLKEQDRSGTNQSPAAVDTLWEIVEHHSLVDIWREHHPDDTSMFTFVRVEAHWSSHSRLDCIYLSRFHLSRAHSSSIRLAPFSDHHLATVTASLCAERPGPAYWHFNNSLLEDEGFMMSFWEFWLACANDRDRLELPLTLAEFSEALCHMPTNKSPGMDGLTVEFYRVFWDVLGSDLVTVWAESLQSGVLPLSCSTDYKIVAKAISLQLGSVLEDVIHPDQTYTIPDRSIFDNLFMVWDLLELGCRDGLSLALLSLDQEKAFNRVDNGYLLSILRAFGFGPPVCGFSLGAVHFRRVSG
ncbi:unnamed protein product [Caretta caretta]